MSQRDPYAVLGIARRADADTIAAAYRDLARLHHPDVSRDPSAQRLMAEINAAWSILRDPVRRAAWDRHDETAAQRAQSSMAAPPAGWAAAPSAGGVAPGAPAWRRGPNGEGAAGPPPGPRRGSVLPFGRHIGWSLGEIARVDTGYLMWLRERQEGAPYLQEIDQILATMGLAPASGQTQPPPRRRSLFRS